MANLETAIEGDKLTQHFELESSPTTISKLNIVQNDPSPWYKEGLSFKCTECGKCCTGQPGYTWVTEDEIVQIAAFLKLSIDDFALKYLRIIDGRFSLREDSRNFDCVFLRDKKCLIYPVRPKQCRTFPWWLHNLQSREDWENAARYCEGINPNAPLVPYAIIEEQLNIQEKLRKLPQRC